MKRKKPRTVMPPIEGIKGNLLFFDYAKLKEAIYQGESEDVTINGKKIIVYQANSVMETKRGIMFNSVVRIPCEDEAIRGLMLIYPSLAACSDGDIPTLMEYILLNSKETGLWYEAVERLNPSWFPKLEDEKKS